MIRINLLAGVGAAEHHRAMTVAPNPQAMRPFLLAAALAATANIGYYFVLQQQASQLAQKTLVEQTHNQQLAQVKARFLARQKEAEEYKRRVEVIEQLRAAQAGPASLLDLLGDTIGGNRSVWLSAVKDNGTSIDMNGQASTPEALSALIAQLQRSGYFRTVEIHESYQDSGGTASAPYQFSLSCEKGKA